jgi:hypothetical protein
MNKQSNLGMRIIFYILLVLTLLTFSSTFSLATTSTGTLVNFNVNTATEITNITTNPIFPYTNNGTQENVEVNFTSSDYPINITFYIYNQTGDLEYSEGVYQINSSIDLPINFTINSNLSEGNYSVNMTVINFIGEESYYLIGNFTVEYPDILAPQITNVTTNPTTPFVNNGSSENVSVNFTSNEYPINVTINIYNQTGDLEFSFGSTQINSSSELPITFEIPSGLSEGNYSINMTAVDSSNNSNIINIGNFSVVYSNTLPIVIAEHPWFGHYTYDINSVIILVANMSSENTLNLTYAEVTLPDSHKQNVSMYFPPTEDNFNTNTVGTYWKVENDLIQENQICIADIDSTVQGKAFTSILGDGSPLSNTYCSLVSSFPFYGDFDMNISFNITHESGDTYGMNLNVLEKGSSTNSGKYATFSLGKWETYGRTYYTYINDGNVSDYFSDRETNDTYGKLRIKREGNNLTFFTWNNSASEWFEEVKAENLDLPHSLYFAIETENAEKQWGRIDVEWEDAQISVPELYVGIFSNTSLQGDYNITFIAKDNLGLINNTEKAQFTIEEVNDIPSTPYFLYPNPDELVQNIYEIVWSDVYDPDGDNLQFNLTLLNFDDSFNQTLFSNYGNSLSNNYYWNTTSILDGHYNLEIIVFENETIEGLSSYSRIDGSFEIDNTKPTIEFTSPTTISGTTINETEIIMNVSVYDLNLDGVYFEIYNSSWDLIYDEYQQQETFYLETNLSLEDGLYYFTASAYDLAGNYEYAEMRNVTIKTKYFILSNLTLHPEFNFGFLGTYNYTINVENRTNIEYINLSYNSKNVDNVSCNSYYVNGSCAKDQPYNANMSLLENDVWYYTPIYPDDIYLSIVYGIDDIFWYNERSFKDIYNDNYHIFKFTNNYTINENTLFWLEFDAIVKSNTVKPIKVYLFDNTTNISTFNSEWFNFDNGEIVGTIQPDVEKHHEHTGNSSHYLIALVTDENGTIGSKKLNISNEFWVVLYVESADINNSWNLSYRNGDLCNTTNWWTGVSDWNTNLQTTGCPDIHTHIARFNVNNQSDCIEATACGKDADNLTDCIYELSCLNTLPNLPPIANQINSPKINVAYSSPLNISWNEFSDPNNDVIKYSIYLLNQDQSINMTIVENITSTNYLWNGYYELEGVFIEDGEYSLKVVGMDPQGEKATTYLSDTFISDDNAPIINIISPTNSSYNTSLVLLNISVTDVSLNEIWFNWNGTNITYTTAINITFEEGVNTIHIYANDSLGRITNKNITFTIEYPDILAPQITNITTVPTTPFVNNGTEENVSVNFTSDEYPINITFNIYNQTGDLEYSEGVYQINSSSELPINFTVPIGLAEGNYTINMTATDSSDNSNTINIGNFTVEYPDILAPQITNVTTNPTTPFVNNGTSENVSVNFTSDEYPINITFNIYNETGDLEYTEGIYQINSSNDLPINFTIPSDLAEGNYTINMTATDSSDNSNTINIGNFTVEYPDILAPQITNITTNPTTPFVNNGTEENVSVNFTSDEYPINITFNIYNQTGDLEYSEGVYQINSSNELPINFTVPNSLAEGNYIINMTVVDSSNNSNTINIGNFSVENTYPTINSITNTPIVGYINQSINISSNITSYHPLDIIYANITYPDLSVLTLYLNNTNNNLYWNIFNPNMTGDYQIIIFANNTISKYITEIGNNFSIGELVLWNSSVYDSNMTGLNSTLEIFYSDTSILLESDENGTFIDKDVSTFLYDLLFKAYDENIQILLKRVNLTSNNNQAVGIDEITNYLGYKLIYAVENNNYSFNTSTVWLSYNNITYTDENKLYVDVCENWNFTSRSCNVAWNNLVVSQDKLEKTFSFNRTKFSAFAIKENTTTSDDDDDDGNSGGSSTYTCLYNWTCSDWSSCNENLTKTRECNNTGTCSNTYFAPDLVISCENIIDEIIDDENNSVENITEEKDDSGMNILGDGEYKGREIYFLEDIFSQSCTKFRKQCIEWWIILLISAIITFMLVRYYIYREEKY